MKTILFLAASGYALQSLSEPYNGTWNFITRQGSRLYEDGKVFRFASYNVPNLLLLEGRPVITHRSFRNTAVCKRTPTNPVIRDGYTYGDEDGETCIVPKPGDRVTTYTNWAEWQIPTVQEQEDAIMTVKGSHGRVIRTYTLGFGLHNHVEAPGKYYEPAMRAMDRALALARKHGIRLIIPFINNHNAGDDDGPTGFGDYQYMARMRGLRASQFWTHPTLVQDMRNIITYVLNRRNTVNGILYKNDPTILAWQLGNELGGWGAPAPAASWILGMSSLIKSLAPRTLVMDGTFGALDSSKKYRIEALTSPNVDMFSNHYYYGSSDLARAQRDATIVVSRHNKVFVMGEFGFQYDNNENLYKLANSDSRFSGALIWALRAHSRDGGFYTHSEGNNYWSFHAPGFPTAAGFGADDYRTAPMIRRYGLISKGLPLNSPYPVPSAAFRIVDNSMTPRSLRWVGAAWAAHYQIFRRQARSLTEVTPWRLINAIVRDNVQSGNIVYRDMTSRTGLYYWYLIQPVGVGGVVDFKGAAILGPFRT